METDYGTANGAFRPAEDDSYYWRVTQILFPFYHMIPGGVLGEGVKIGAYVPMDDYHHLQWEIGVFKPNGEALGRSVARGNPGMDAPLGSRRLPNGTGWYERFRSDQNLDNDFKIDREAQAQLARATPASPAFASRTAPSRRRWARSTTARPSTSARRTSSSSAPAASSCRWHAPSKRRARPPSASTRRRFTASAQAKW